MRQQSVLCIFALLGFAANSMVAYADAESPEVVAIQNSTQVFPTPDYNKPFSERNTLIGSLDGWRQKLANEGITLDANLTQVTQGVAAGGIEEGWEYSGRGETRLNLDTSKLGWWPGGLLTVIGEGNYGSSLSNKTGALLGTNVNDLFPESENSFVIPQVLFTQFLSPEFAISIGKFTTITATGGDMNEFAHGKGSDKFLNPNFNFNPLMAVTVPYSTLGVAGIYLPSKDLTITVSAINPYGKPGSAGFDDLFTEGATFASEGRYTTHFFGKTGHQLLGATVSTANYVDLDQRAANFIFPGLPVEQASNSWAAYWNADQYFYQPDTTVNRGVGVFARFGISDGKANPIENFASFGIGGKGVIPCRENDGFGIGFFYSWAVNNSVTSLAGFEDAQGYEAYYEIALTPALKLSPDIQWIDPSQQRVDSSWVLGARLFSAF